MEAVGDIATYSGWTTITTTTIFTKPTTTATTYTPGPTYSQAFAPGTDTDCDVYLDGVDSTNNPLQNSGISTSDWDSLGYNFNNCSVYESLYEVNVTQLVSWNPSLTTSNCTLQMGYSYCVLKSWDRKCSIRSILCFLHSGESDIKYFSYDDHSSDRLWRFKLSLCQQHMDYARYSLRLQLLHRYLRKGERWYDIIY